MLTISPIEQRILRRLGRYRFLTAQQMWKGIGNKSLQVIYEDVRMLKEKGLLGSITYGGVSRTGTMQKLHYLTRKGAVIVAETEGIGLEQVKFPKSTNTLVKNDFLHRIATIDLMIAFDQWINTN